MQEWVVWQGLSVQTPWAWSAEAQPSPKQGFQAPGRGGASCQGLREIQLLCSASVLSFQDILDRFPAREEMPQGGLVWCYSSIFTRYGPCSL